MTFYNEIKKGSNVARFESPNSFSNSNMRNFWANNFCSVKRSDESTCLYVNCVDIVKTKSRRGYFEARFSSSID